ncbi:MAG: hypothetical protein K6G07_03680 [Lachnospiraceae bacterium]|nr:hypothetical protein [Lachnospiraceae bacterium]
MNYCSNCKITVYDDRESCPLCHKVLERAPEEKAKEIRQLLGAKTGYPNVKNRERIIRFVVKLLTFLCVVGALASVAINYLFFPGFHWSGIVVIAVLYLYLFMRYWLSHDSGFASKVGMQLFFTMALVFAIDYFTGNRGWALEWVIPGLILLGDAFVFFFMMLNRQNWYTYSLLLVLFTFASAGIMALYMTKHINSFILPLICMLVSGVYLIATVIFGDRQFTREMKRRFHV